MRLVYYVVSKQYPTFLHDEDVIQAGMLGLCKAGEHWDETRCQFSTYATTCIRNEINREFVQRKPYSNLLSLDKRTEDTDPLIETIAGDDNVAYFDNLFYDDLSDEEQDILNLNNFGFSNVEIADMRQLSVQKVQKILRIVRLKWEKFNES